MRKSILILISAVIGAISAYADVKVGWKSPDAYRDIRVNDMSPERSLNLIRERLGAHIDEQAQRYIPEGSTLRIRVVDLDLAGEIEPWWGPQFDSVRIIRSIYPPSIELEYTLEDGEGRTLKEGRERITDLNFDFGVNRRSLDRFEYEKEMLSSWLRRTFRDDD